MDISKILAELHSELEKTDQAILALERLAAGSVAKRRGRRPKWLSLLADNEGEKETVAAATFSTRRRVSEAARKRMAEAQKKRWAAKKAGANSHAT